MRREIMLEECPNCGSIWGPGSEEWQFQECDCCGYPKNVDESEDDEWYDDEDFEDEDLSDATARDPLAKKGIVDSPNNFDKQQTLQP